MTLLREIKMEEKYSTCWHDKQVKSVFYVEFPQERIAISANIAMVGKKVGEQSISCQLKSNTFAS